MNLEGNYLITTDNWFYGPDGKVYRAVWGDVKIMDDSLLGIRTNRNSSNWYAFVGSEEKGMILAGCQVHYAIRCNEKPNQGKVHDYSTDGGTFNEFVRPSQIYFAQ